MVCGRHRVPGSGGDAPPRPRGEWKGTRTVQRQRAPSPKDARHRSPAEGIPSLFLKVNPSSPSSRAPRDPGDYRAGGALELRGSGLPAGRGAGAQVSASAPGVRGHRPSNSAWRSGLRAAEGTQGGEPRRLGRSGKGPSGERRTGGGMRGPTRGEGCLHEQPNDPAANLGTRRVTFCLSRHFPGPSRFLFCKRQKKGGELQGAREGKSPYGYWWGWVTVTVTAAWQPWWGRGQLAVGVTARATPRQGCSWVGSLAGFPPPPSCALIPRRSRSDPETSWTDYSRMPGPSFSSCETLDKSLTLPL